MKPILTLCLFSLLASPTLSQSRFSFGVKMDAGLASVSGKEFLEQMDFVETRTSYSPGLSASVGLVSEYYLDEHLHFGVSVGLLSNFSSFTQQQQLLLQDFTGQNVVGEVDKDNIFRLVNFQAPVKLVYRHKKMTFSLGVINNWLGFAELEGQSRSRGVNPTSAWFDGSSVTISTSTLGKQQSTQSSFFELGTNLDHRYTPQILCGVAYEIRNNLSLGLEFTNQLRANYIYHSDVQIDLVFFEEHKFKHNALFLSLIWWTETK
ncbi:MAG: hypothetical protein ACKV1O_10590 [Saprospiraceae bacterium]